MWDLPGPGLEPVSPALAGRFLTTVPPGKSPFPNFLMYVLSNNFSECMLVVKFCLKEMYLSFVLEIVNFAKFTVLD